MGTSTEIQSRRDVISDIFAERGDARTTVDEVVDALKDHPEMEEFWKKYRLKTSKDKPKPTRTKHASHSNDKTPAELEDLAIKRMVLRDLELLQRQQVVELIGALKAGAFVDISAIKGNDEPKDGERKWKEPVKLVWRAGPRLSDDNGLDTLAANMALRTVFNWFSWAIPEELQKDLKFARDRAERRLKKLRADTPAIRWLGALDFQLPYHPFESPMIDEDVRSTIEKAIIDRKKLRLSYSIGNDETIAIVSVSRLIITLPDRPAVEIWKDDEENDSWLDGGPPSYRIPLEWIIKAELTEVSARWPGDFKSRIEAPSHRKEPDNLVDVYEFRASPRQMQSWKGKWIETRLEVIGYDEHEWAVCRYVDRDHLGIRRYLAGLWGDIELLSPYFHRLGFQTRSKQTTAMYSDSQDVPAKLDEFWMAEWFSRVRKLHLRPATPAEE